jgi:hypothetical protein
MKKKKTHGAHGAHGGIQSPLRDLRVLRVKILPPLCLLPHKGGWYPCTTPHGAPKLDP